MATSLSLTVSTEIAFFLFFLLLLFIRQLVIHFCGFSGAFDYYMEVSSTLETIEPKVNLVVKVILLDYDTIIYPRV